MKALVCEMCGSHEIIKKAGFYQCESCGTKYDTEEAKKLLVTVTVDDSRRVANYLELSKQSKQAGDYASAETYCNKALELDAKSYEAWLMKGEVIAAQFGKGNNRLEESMSCYKHAAEIAPSDTARQRITSSLSSFETDQIKNRCQQYESTGSRYIADEIMLIIDCIDSGNSDYEAVAGERVLTDRNLKLISKWVSNSAARAWNRCIAPKFMSSANSSTDAFFEDGLGALLLTERAIALDGENDERNLVLYENLLDMSESLMSPIVPVPYKQVVMGRRSIWEPEAKRLKSKMASSGYRLEDDKRWTKPKEKNVSDDGRGWVSNRVGCLIVLIVAILVIIMGGFIWG